MKLRRPSLTPHRSRAASLAFLAAGAMLTAASLLPAASSGSTSQFPDMRGTYAGGACIGVSLSQCMTSPTYNEGFTISAEDFSTGVVTITGSGPVGTISGCMLTINWPPSGGYTSENYYTISADTNQLTGTFSDSNGRSGDPIYVNRTSAAGPDTCPTTTTTTTTSASSSTSSSSTSSATTSTTSTSTTSTAGKHASAMQIVCNYDVASSTNVCGASVADADASGGTVTEPTGTVTFTGPADGFFSSGSKCTLAPQAAAPSGVGYCQIVFWAPDGSLPTIAATYGGDAQHAGSSGQTQFLGGDPSGDTTDTESTPPPGQYPNKLDTTTTVPSDGTTVEACAESAGSTAGTSAAAAIAAPVAHVGDIVGDILGAGTSLVNPVITDAKALAALQATLNGDTPAQLNQAETPAFEQKSNSDLARAMADLAAANAQVNNIGLSPSQETATAAALANQQALLDVLSQEMSERAATMCKVAQSLSNAPLQLLAGAASTRTAKSKLLVLGSTVVRDVSHGALKIPIKLKRALLSRLGKGHSSVVINVRVVMVLPSKVLSHGVTVLTVEHLRLTRGRPKHKKKK